MKKQKIFVLLFLGVCVCGISLINLNVINVVSAGPNLVLHILPAVEISVPVLFYVFFIKGINPDCVELILDDQVLMKNY
jgi:hypothetical protein